MPVHLFVEDRIAELENRVDDEQALAFLGGVRAVIDQHQQNCTDNICPTCRVSWPCPTLQLLAMPFASHPDHDPAWAVPRP
jgi:hypothetical protein